MDKRELGKWLSGIGITMLGFGCLLIFGVMPRGYASRPLGDKWEIAVPLIIIGAIVFVVGLKWEMERRSK